MKPHEQWEVLREPLEARLRSLQRLHELEVMVNGSTASGRIQIHGAYIKPLIRQTAAELIDLYQAELEGEDAVYWKLQNGGVQS